MVARNKYGEEYEIANGYQRGRADMEAVIDEMRLRAEQEAVLGPDPKELTPEQQAAFNRMRLKKLMGE